MRVAVALSVILVLAGAVRADDNEAAALAHIDRGVAAFHAGEYTRAHREFTAAHELVPDRANPYRWLALTEMQLGDCASAVPNIAEFERRVPADDPRLAELIRLRVLCEREQKTPPPAPPPETVPPPPLYRRAWFWGAVAGTVLVTGGVIAGLALSGGDVARLPPVQCGDTGCTP
jgi:hypothetical protein